jgi:2,5-diketo-D-gluconate reductase A
VTPAETAAAVDLGIPVNRNGLWVLSGMHRSRQSRDPDGVGFARQKWASTSSAHPIYKEAEHMSTVPSITLNDGNTIPQLGFGVFQIEPSQTAAAVRSALEVGYRHVDTAEMYGNEKEVGQGIRDAGLDRGEVFITSKLNNGFHLPDDARRAFDATLSALNSDYVDLFLIHWPLPTLYDGDFLSTWNVLEEFAKDGRARSIGVSNFQPAHLDLLAEDSQTTPAVNQIEVHPYFGNEQVRAYDRAHGIATEAWSPIAQGKVLDDEVIVSVAKSLGKTPAQVVLRWHIQRGDIVFPKSVSPERVKSNFEIFDFSLTEDGMDAITGLDRGETGRTGPNPDKFDYIPN